MTAYGEKITEGKTKVIYKLVNEPYKVVVKSKDRITAGDGARSHDLSGKAAISTTTAGYIFDFLNKAGIKTHYVRQYSDTEFIAKECAMVPLEWVTRRIATGSFLKRHPGVKEGYRFTPPKLEIFYKDDANNDPQWSKEQVIAAKMKHGNVIIGSDEVEIMGRITVCVFEILERAWNSLDCALVDMKIEFGISLETGEIVVADIIDSDSWRLWPSGDKRLMKDKQVYRELKEVTNEGLETVKRNFQWVADKVKELDVSSKGRVVILMGSPSDGDHCRKICTACEDLHVPCELRLASAHKSTTQTLGILAEYEGDGIPTVFIAVAGRSNGLGPVLAGNTSYPVINCPPLKADWAAEDIWSSLRLPSGLGCSTVISPEGAAIHAAEILALSDHVIWSRLHAKQTNTWVDLKLADKKMRISEQST